MQCVLIQRSYKSSCAPQSSLGASWFINWNRFTWGSIVPVFTATMACHSVNFIANVYIWHTLFSPASLTSTTRHESNSFWTRVYTWGWLKYTTQAGRKGLSWMIPYIAAGVSARKRAYWRSNSPSEFLAKYALSLHYHCSRCCYLWIQWYNHTLLFQQNASSAHPSTHWTTFNTYIQINVVMDYHLVDPELPPTTGQINYVW